MIVETMTFDEVAKYLWRTSFSDENVSKPYRKMHENTKKYNKAIALWNRTHKEEDKCKIFKQLRNKGKYDETLIFVPFCYNGIDLDFVCFVTFNYGNRKFAAMKCVAENQVMFYSWHSLRRYAERFLKDADAEIDDIFIGDMLVYNTQLITKSYIHDGKETLMLITTDGAFLCDKYGENYVARTFISQEEYFSNQEEIDAEAIQELKAHRKNVFNEGTDR